MPARLPASHPAPAPRLRAFRIWTVVHTWSSLISMVFMLMLCLTGLPLIFHHELNHALGYEVDPPDMPAGTPLASLDRVVEAALARRPGEAVHFVSFDRDEPNAAIVSLGKTVDADPQDNTFVSVDRRTARVINEPKLTEGPVAFLLKLHTKMFLGLPGGLFLGAMALLFLVAIVSGVVLYGPFMRKLDFGTVRRDRSRRIRWLDWHNLAGVTTLTWALLVGGTGMINTWADLMLKLWQFGQLAEMTAPYKGSPRPVELASLQGAVDTAIRAAPEMTPQVVAFPGTIFSSNNHYAVFMAGNTPLTSRLLKPALIDGATGRLTEMRAMPWYIQVLFVSQPLHFGDYGGLPLKILWAVLDLATILVLVSGLYLWVARRRSSAPASAGAGMRRDRPGAKPGAKSGARPGASPEAAE